MTRRGDDGEAEIRQREKRKEEEEMVRIDYTLKIEI
jgi:hypothetical protein